VKQHSACTVWPRYQQRQFSTPARTDIHCLRCDISRGGDVALAFLDTSDGYRPVASSSTSPGIIAVCCDLIDVVAAAREPQPRLASAIASAAVCQRGPHDNSLAPKISNAIPLDYPLLQPLIPAARLRTHISSPAGAVPMYPYLSLLLGREMAATRSCVRCRIGICSLSCPR